MESLPQEKINHFDELEIKDIFEILKNKEDKEETFLNILKKENGLENTKDDFLQKLWFVESNNKDEKTKEFFTKNRKLIIEKVDLNLFFASLSKKEEKILKKYKRYVGEIKDDKDKPAHINWLIENTNYFFEKINNPTPYTVENFEEKYNKLIEELKNLHNKTSSDFSEQDFHDFRKKIRTISNIIMYLAEETNKAEHTALSQKYKNISKILGEVLSTDRATNNGYKLLLDKIISA